MLLSPIQVSESSASPFSALAVALRRVRGPLTQTELARLAGVSNKTISEYERGKFGITGSPQADVLAKWAAATSSDPASLFRMAGLEYSSDRVTKAARQVALRVEMKEGRPFATSTAGHNTVEELRTAKIPHIRIGILRSTSAYETFDIGIVQMLCSLINHRWKCEIRYLSSVKEQIDALFSHTDRCHIVAGIIETLSRASLGLSFIPYPGVEYGLDAVCSDDAPSVSWSDVQLKAKDIIAITVENEAGDEFLRALCDYDSGSVIAVEGRDVDKLRTVYRDAVERFPGRPVIVCATEDLCYQLIQSAPLERWHLLSELEPSARDIIPKYRVGCIVRYGDNEWLSLLRDALSYAFHFTPAKVAELYAGLLSAMIPVANPDSHNFSFGRLAPLEIRESQRFIDSLRFILPEKLKSRAFATRSHQQIVEHALSRSSGDDRVTLGELKEHVVSIGTALSELRRELSSLMPKALAVEREVKTKTSHRKKSAEKRGRVQRKAKH